MRYSSKGEAIVRSCGLPPRPAGGWQNLSGGLIAQDDQDEMSLDHPSRVEGEDERVRAPALVEIAVHIAPYTMAIAGLCSHRRATPEFAERMAAMW